MSGTQRKSAKPRIRRPRPPEAIDPPEEPMIPPVEQSIEPMETVMDRLAFETAARADGFSINCDTPQPCTAPGTVPGMRAWLRPLCHSSRGLA